jgi:hypothetical protein
LGGSKTGHDLAAKGGLAHLARTGEQDHFTAEVGRDLIQEITVHADYFSGSWRKVATFFQ